MTITNKNFPDYKPPPPPKRGKKSKEEITDPPQPQPRKETQAIHDPHLMVTIHDPRLMLTILFKALVLVLLVVTIALSIGTTIKNMSKETIPISKQNIIISDSVESVYALAYNKSGYPVVWAKCIKWVNFRPAKWIVTMNMSNHYDSYLLTDDGLFGTEGDRADRVNHLFDSHEAAKECFLKYWQ